MIQSLSDAGAGAGCVWEPPSDALKVNARSNWNQKRRARLYLGVGSQ